MPHIEISVFAKRETGNLWKRVIEAICSASDNPLIDPTCMSVTLAAMNESRTKSRANLENSVAVVQRLLLPSTVSISKVTPQHTHRGLADREKLRPAHTFTRIGRAEMKNRLLKSWRD